jgi:hypothetical protein
MTTGTELQIRKEGADIVESEVRAELQIRSGSVDSVDSATSHEDGHTVADEERKCGWRRPTACPNGPRT